MARMHTRGAEVAVSSKHHDPWTGIACYWFVFRTLEGDGEAARRLEVDYLIAYIYWFVKERLGKSARGMIILDAKPEFLAQVEAITRNRRFEVPAVHRVKWIVEFSYPVDSKKNPMVQLSDLVIYCSKKFLEVDNGYRDTWPDAAKRFYAECYSLIDDRIARKQLVERNGRAMDQLNIFLASVRSTPNGRWKRRYGL